MIKRYLLLDCMIILALYLTPCNAESGRSVRPDNSKASRPVTAQYNDRTITLSCGDNTILSYYLAIHDVPEGVDPAYRRSGFIHPLYSPAGHRLTRIQPPDHYHHYGIWNPWTKTQIDGKEVDFWNLAKKEGTVRFAELLSTDSGPSAGGFKVRQEHVQFLPEGKERVVMNEVWDVRAAVGEIEQKPVWIVDLVSQLENLLDTPIVLDEYRYGGGLGFRATEQWTRDNSTVLTSEDKTRKDADGTRARWCDVNGSTGDKDQISGILFMSHPDNREHPEPMRVWPEDMMGRGDLFFEFCPIRLKAWTLEPKHTYVLRYRMVVYDGKLKPETMEALWQNYAQSPAVNKEPDKKQHVLIYTKNGKGYVHENIAASVKCLEKICKDNGWTFETTDNAAVFTREKISKFDVLIFSNTNNETFDTEQQKEVFQWYIRSGGGFVGIHSACGSERNWPWFWANLGGKFVWHPQYQPFEILVVDKTHPSTSHLPAVWKWEDECYFMNELNPGIHILLAADLTSLKIDTDRIKDYPGRTFGGTFPLAWCQEFDGGRQWYTALGHSDKHYEDENYIRHLTGGICWAMKKQESKKK